MARRRSFVPARRNSNKLPRSWTTSEPPLGAVITLPPTGTSSVGIAFAGSVNEVDQTVLRTRGVLTASLDALVGSNGHVLCGFGMGVVTAQAALVGGVPTPLDDGDWDGWFVHMTRCITTSSGGVQPEFADGFSWQIDSKAMRKVHAGNVILASFQIYNIGGTTLTSTVRLSAFLRGLIKHG